MAMPAPRRGRPPKAPAFQAVPPEAIVEVAVPVEVPPEPPAPAPVQTAALFRAKHVPIHHPYQNVLIPISGSVPLMLDNWVEVQVAAKVIQRV